MLQYTPAQVAKLDAAFNRVCSAHDWKSRIQACIPEEDFEITQEAVMFYTATELFIIFRQSDGMVNVYADGYGLGPAGDH